MVRQVPVLGTLMIVHGVMLVLMAVMMGVGGAALGMISDMPPGAVGVGDLSFMFGFLALSGVLHLVPAILQIVSGVKLMRRRGKVLAFVALGSGFLTVLNCYCAVTSIPLLAYGLVVLLNEGVADVLDIEG
jgi:hypothetical protein